MPRKRDGETEIKRTKEMSGKTKNGFLYLCLVLLLNAAMLKEALLGPMSLTKQVEAAVSVSSIVAVMCIFGIGFTAEMSCF